MQKETWKKRINSQLENLGTYSPEYSVAIDSLADALAQYDSTMKQWIDSSKANGFKTLQMVVEYTNKACHLLHFQKQQKYPEKRVMNWMSS